MFRRLTTPRQAVRNCHKSSRLGTRSGKACKFEFLQFRTRFVQCGILPESQSGRSCLPVRTWAKKAGRQSPAAPLVLRRAGRNRRCRRAYRKRCNVPRRQQFVHGWHRFGPKFAQGCNILLVRFAGTRVSLFRGFCGSDISSLHHFEIPAEIAIEYAKARSHGRARLKLVELFRKVRERVGKFLGRVAGERFAPFVELFLSLENAFEQTRGGLHQLANPVREVELRRIIGRRDVDPRVRRHTELLAISLAVYG